MKVIRTSLLSGITHEKDLDITEEQIKAFNHGMLVQDAFPHLSADDREFILTGITPDEWDAEFKPLEEETDEKYNDFYIGKNR